MKPTLIVISGPTAVGKTAFAIELAKKLNAEILSADSRQFFKEISIGTAKPSKMELDEVKHHFIDNKSISEDYNASDFESEVLSFLSHYFLSHKYAILVGGSGLYIDAVCQGFDSNIPDADPSIRKELAEKFKENGITSLVDELNDLDPDAINQIDVNNPKRLMRAIEICRLTNAPLNASRKGQHQKRFFNCVQIGLEMDREKLYSRINARVDNMINSGLIDEAKVVRPYKDKNALKTVGYRELFDHFEGLTDLEFAINKIKINTRRYAKRQLTWFKRNEAIEWFNTDQLFEVITYIRNNEQS